METGGFSGMINIADHNLYPPRTSQNQKYELYFKMGDLIQNQRRLVKYD